MVDKNQQEAVSAVNGAAQKFQKIFLKDIHQWIELLNYRCYEDLCECYDTVWVTVNDKTGQNI